MVQAAGLALKHLVVSLTPVVFVYFRQTTFADSRGVAAHMGFISFEQSQTSCFPLFHSAKPSRLLAAASDFMHRYKSGIILFI